MSRHGTARRGMRQGGGHRLPFRPVAEGLFGWRLTPSARPPPWPHLVSDGARSVGSTAAGCEPGFASRAALALEQLGPGRLRPGSRSAGAGSRPCFGPFAWLPPPCSPPRVWLLPYWRRGSGGRRRFVHGHRATREMIPRHTGPRVQRQGVGIRRPKRASLRGRLASEGPAANLGTVARRGASGASQEAG